MIPGVNHASGSIQSESSPRFLLELVQDFIERVNLLRQVFGLAFCVRRAVRPAHPRGHAVNSAIPAWPKLAREPLLDLVVAKDGWNPALRQLPRPERLPAAGHANQRQPQRSFYVCFATPKRIVYNSLCLSSEQPALRGSRKKRCRPGTCPCGRLAPPLREWYVGNDSAALCSFSPAVLRELPKIFSLPRFEEIFDGQFEPDPSANGANSKPTL